MVRIHCRFLSKNYLVEEAVIYRILAESEFELGSLSEGSVWTLGNPERVIEDAALSLLRSIKIHTIDSNDIMGSNVNLFSFANQISAERYEGEGSKGRLIIIAPRNHQDIEVKIKFKFPIDTSNYRGVRKLLEVSSDELALLCDVSSIWGLGTPLDTDKPSLENLFEIRFTKHYTWELVHADNVMLHVEYRKPRLPKEHFDRELFYDHVYLLFKVNKKTTKLVIEAVEAAVEQRHGTMLIITPEAEAETKRLEAESTPIEPISVSKDIISHVSSVDGAILMTPDGTLYAFGVILDGEASKNGNRSRGARYNSAIRYIDTRKNHNIDCLALIVSEDGYVDLYPTLKRRIPRVWIDELLDELELYANLAKPYNSDTAWSTLATLVKLCFYLLEQDIERANKIKDMIVKLEHQYRQERVAGTGMGYLIPSCEDFKVNPEMNEEYYLPDESI